MQRDMLCKVITANSTNSSSYSIHIIYNIAKTATSRNVAFKSDKLMDALFQEGQSAPQTPQTFFDADFEGLASNAELYIFNQEDSQE